MLMSSARRIPEVRQRRNNPACRRRRGVIVGVLVGVFGIGVFVPAFVGVRVGVFVGVRVGEFVGVPVLLVVVGV